MSEGLEIKLFGGLKIYKDGQPILESLSNTRKTKFFLSYLIMNIDKEIPHKELFDLLWFGEDYSNPGTALRTILYRYRQLIDQNHVDELTDSITSRKGHYKWNSLPNVKIDMYDFESNALKGLNEEVSEEASREYLKKAIPLYQGRLFPEAEQDHWVVQKANYYREMYMKTVHKYIGFLKNDELYDDIIKISDDALEIIGKCQLIENEKNIALELKENKQDGADEKYAVMNERIGKMSLKINDIQGEMEAVEADHTAFVCDYATFLQVYRLQRRLLLRSGETMFLSLVTLEGEGNYLVSEKKHLMDLLENCFKNELRMGDSICRISDNEYAILYPVDTYENALGVMERIKNDFFKQINADGYEFLYYIRPLKNCDE